MHMTKEKGTYIQCQHCGAIYHIDRTVPIDKMYVASTCPECNEYGKGLNCGSNKDDLYELMDINSDPRYYEY